MKKGAPRVFLEDGGARHSQETNSHFSMKSKWGFSIASIVEMYQMH